MFDVHERNEKEITCLKGVWSSEKIHAFLPTVLDRERGFQSSVRAAYCVQRTARCRAKT